MTKNLIVKIIVSESVETQYNGIQQRQLIVNPVISLRTKFIPTSLSMGITIIVAGMEANNDYNINIKLKHKETNNVVFVTGDNKFTPPPQADNFIANVDLKNIAIEHEGEYLATIEIDGEPYSDKFFILKSLD